MQFQCALKKCSLCIKFKYSNFFSFSNNDEAFCESLLCDKIKPTGIVAQSVSKYRKDGEHSSSQITLEIIIKRSYFPSMSLCLLSESLSTAKQNKNCQASFFPNHIMYNFFSNLRKH